ncbi:GNAT family N-acetyltransferase [Treponema primitia]|uniref:GNAT family N-acetyltransferase n=1 Tax=Treponema primitia TaxID=88058 RepID=UPI00398061E6
MKKRWRRAGKSEAIRTEEFLRSHEYYCVNACAQFLQKNSPHEQVWYLTDPDGTISAVLLRFGGMLFPVFGSTRNPPLPRFIKSFLGRISIRAVLGMLDEAELLETALASRGYHAAEHRNYDLMTLDSQSGWENCSGPQELVLRKPGFTDMDLLYPLQAAYEKEEVLPKDTAFNPVACRCNLSKILTREQSLIACLGTRIVGKINTNAASFSRVQIGGVYVLPEYRGQGIGRRMTAAFVGELIKAGRGLTLFVKKDNPAAQKIYRQLGFKTIGDYRISYY